MFHNTPHLNHKNVLEGFFIRAKTRAHTHADEVGSLYLKAVSLAEDYEQACIALDKLVALLAWLHEECIIDACGLDGGDVQEKLLELGFLEGHIPEPGTSEADEFGTEDELFYLKQEWLDLLPKKGGLHV